jgi:hypothetical protein
MRLEFAWEYYNFQHLDMRLNIAQFAYLSVHRNAIRIFRFCLNGHFGFQMRESVVLWGGDERAGLWRHGATGNQGPRGLVPPRHTGILAHPVVLFIIGSRTDSFEKIRMRFSRVWMRFSQSWMRFSQSCMRLSRVVRASDSQCRSRNCPGFDPSILRHSGIWGATDETVLNTVHKKPQNIPF